LGPHGTLSFLTTGAFSGAGNLNAAGISGTGLSLQGIPLKFNVSRVAAPEIDPASAAGGITLLLGCLLVLRGTSSKPSRVTA
jgi:hypothetical protein